MRARRKDEPRGPLAAAQARAPISGGWEAWRPFLLRGAGFAFELLSPLSTSGAARAVDAGAPDAEALWAREDSAARAHLREVAADRRFREAVLWQNPGAVEDGLDSLLRQPAGATDSRTRKKELLVASYLQRYCAKNDMIGFFGPVGWGRFGEEALLRSGVGLVKARHVSFEPWAIAAAGRALARTPAVKSALRPRLCADLWVERSTLYGMPGGRSLDGGIRLSASDARLLLRCDGRRTAAELARAHGPSTLQRLATFERQAWIRWDFEIAIERHPEERVAAVLSGLRASPKVRQAREAFGRLVQARDRVAAAAGEPQALQAALAELAVRFEALAGEPSSRNAGKTYGGRGLVYEDCERDVELSLPAKLLSRAAGPLRLVLESARWYTAELASSYERALHLIHAQLGDGVGLVELWRAAGLLFEGAPAPPIAEVVGRLKDHWSRAVRPTGRRGATGEAPEPGERVRRMTAAELSRILGRRFRAAAPGWPGARHQAPDLLIQAADLDAIRRGELELVLGELHPGVMPYSTLSVLSACPHRALLEALFEADLPGPQVGTVPSETFARSTHDLRLSRDAWHLDLGAEWSSPLPPGRVLRIADFVVRARAGRLWAQHRDGEQSWPLLCLMERAIKLRAASHFDLVPDLPHVPRLIVDGVVLWRERWRFGPEALGFAAQDDRFRRFAGARAWARTRGLPRHVFVKAPEEVKPLYVDLESSVLVELLCRMAKKASALSVTEMLPGPDGLWLRDGQGRRYTSELRLVVRDERTFAP